MGTGRLIDARAGRLCTCCNKPKPKTPRPHCPSPTCTWWKCEICGAFNDPAGANSRTLRDGSKRPENTR